MRCREQNEDRRWKCDEDGKLRWMAQGRGARKNATSKEKSNVLLVVRLVPHFHPLALTTPSLQPLATPLHVPIACAPLLFFLWLLFFFAYFFFLFFSSNKILITFSRLIVRIVAEINRFHFLFWPSPGATLPIIRSSF